MKRNSERGVALVITLIMLALVTSMAVVFLAVSRREKSSVTITGDITTARYMAESAYARAQSELIARMLSTTNPFDYDLIVATNYYNPAGFISGNTNADNVNYEYRNNRTLMRAGGTAADRADWLRNIANLQYDPRPPVFIATNLTGLRTNDFRFYLDFNRNGLFEPTGLLSAENESGRFGTNYYVGDPQWIGVLERPDLPHSETNQFIGRYTYVIVPSGKALDINYMHNDAKRLRNDVSMNGFLRHQGVGSWEINLAGFLVGLNTNLSGWGGNLAYNYNPVLGTPSTGVAFDDATAILRHRYEGNLTKLASARAFFNFAGAGNNPFTTNGIDYYSDGPINTYAADNVQQPWSGSFNPNGYYDIQELFDANKTSPGFVNRLTNNNIGNAYNRYTFYRLLSQLTTDSQELNSNKLYFADFQQHFTNRMHLSYQNLVPNAQTNFIPWTPISFFTNASDRLLRSSLDLVVLTNGNRLQTNFMMGLTPVRSGFCATNIQLYHIDAGRSTALPFYATNNEYSSTVHRLLQVAANIHDSTTIRSLGLTNDYPSVFRPVFTRTSTNLIISGYVEETNTFFLNYPWMTVEQATLAATLPLNRPSFGVNIYGVPPVIGAKKGYPNFNKMVLQTVAEVSRRLEVRKSSPTGPPTETNQMYVIGISNRFGIEGWNSYQRDFNRNLELRVAGESTFAFHHRADGSVATNYLPRITNWFFGGTNILARWPGTGGSNTVSPNSFVVAVDTNLPVIPNSVYLTANGTLLPLTTNVFEKSYRVPQWLLRLTNRVQYALIDRTANRVIDFVNLDKLISVIDLSKGLTGDTNAGGGGIFSDKNRPTGKGASTGTLTDGDMWNPTHSSASVDSPSLGVLGQIGVAKGQPFSGEGVWRSANGQVADKETSIQQFKQFLTGGLTNLAWQVPFTPSRRLYQRTSWEANDPLVHYTVEDLADPIMANSTNLQVRAISFDYPIARDAMLRELNPRYRPWGGNPNKDPSNDGAAYALTLKDPLVRRSDDWQFPTNKLPNIGWLGRIHRGTPWQTLYLKAGVDPRTRRPLDLGAWALWSGSFGTHPTNDWRLLDLFTVAPNDSSARGVLSVNQTNYAAWAAVLSGVSTVTNSTADSAIGPNRAPRFQEILVQPNTAQMKYIVDGITRVHLEQPNRTYRTVGEVLAVPELTVFSPFLNVDRKQSEQGLDDSAYERIPQQIMSLLRTDEPRVTVYAFGQSLKPAIRSLVTDTTLRPPIFNLCTNYQITGEFASKTVLRLEDVPSAPTVRTPTTPMAQKMRAVVESYSVLQSD